ncbi:hypothetical protein OHB26_26320 [Nocardia sp. NBC_01503]|uniref:hypothetical protein n=1 Tax=Nocardia sp. NBC_01503 TaxID=2975997 RepID=UPI002E7BA3E7|nr:hypothetical protein [Nocardia sp. NBC_01503]WTL30434.1 hypothetical protein OHB26_26320 [Nocardia sp. NBC_01503]
MNQQHRRSIGLGSALSLGAAALVSIAAPAAHADAPCRIDRTLDTATYTCPEGMWYAAVVECLGTRQVGNGFQSPTYIVGDSPRPLIPMTIECNGDGKRGIVLNAYTDGPF